MEVQESHSKSVAFLVSLKHQSAEFDVLLAYPADAPAAPLASSPSERPAATVAGPGRPAAHLHGPGGCGRLPATGGSGISEEERIEPGLR